MNNKNVEILNAANENGLLPFLFASLISADSLVNIDACNKAIEMFSDFIEAIPETNLDNKEKWVEKCKSGIKIAERDKKQFE